MTGTDLCTEITRAKPKGEFIYAVSGIRLPERIFKPKLCGRS